MPSAKRYSISRTSISSSGRNGATRRHCSIVSSLAQQDRYLAVVSGLYFPVVHPSVPTLTHKLKYVYASRLPKATASRRLARELRWWTVSIIFIWLVGRKKKSSYKDKQTKTLFAIVFLFVFYFHQQRMIAAREGSELRQLFVTFDWKIGKKRIIESRTLLIPEAKFLSVAITSLPVTTNFPTKPKRTFSRRTADNGSGLAISANFILMDLWKSSVILSYF